MKPPSTSSSSTPTKELTDTTPTVNTPKAEPSKAHPQDDNSGDDTSNDKRQTTGFRWFVVCIALYVSCFMYGLDTTIAADIQSAVIETFFDVSQIAWIGAGFPLGSVAVILPYGSLFASFNMKWLYIAGIVLFHTGSALCGAAPTMDALIVGRVIAGMGGTGIYLGGLNSLSALTTQKERGLYITGIACVWSLGCILGPVVGGSFSVSAATWRWSFYMNLVIGAATAPVYLFFLPSIHSSRLDSTRDRLKSLDFLGFILNAGIWVTFSLALISAGGIWAWNDGRTIATLVVFAALVTLYAAQQYLCLLTTPSTRSFPCHLLKSRTQLLLYVGTACSTASMYVTTYYIPLYFQFAHNDSALMAAVRLLPFIVVLSVLNLSSGWALPKTGCFYAPVYLASGLLMTLGGALFYVYLTPDAPTGAVYGVSVVVAIGAAMTFQIGYAVATIKADPAHMVDAVSFQNVSQVGTNAICLAIASQAFQTTAVKNLTAVLAGKGFSDADIHDAVAGARSTLFTQLDGVLRADAIAAITNAMQTTFILVLVAGAMCAVAGALMRWERLLK